MQSYNLSDMQYILGFNSVSSMEPLCDAPHSEKKCYTENVFHLGKVGYVLKRTYI